VSPSGLSPYKRQEPGQQKPGPEWQESRAAVKEESQIASRFLVLAPGWRVSVIVRLLHVTTPSGELAQKELLEACANPFSRANRKLSEH
jgi:hypothetical protein